MKRIYNYADLKAAGFDFSNQHLRRLEEAGKFPKRFKLVPGAGMQGHVGWDGDEIDKHARYVASLRHAEPSAA